MARDEVMRALLKRLWRDDSGQDTTEYVLLILLMVLTITAGMMVLATSINDSFDDASSVLDTAPASAIGS